MYKYSDYIFKKVSKGAFFSQRNSLVQKCIESSFEVLQHVTLVSLALLCAAATQFNLAGAKVDKVAKVEP